MATCNIKQINKIEQALLVQHRAGCITSGQLGDICRALHTAYKFRRAIWRSKVTSLEDVVQELVGKV